MSYSIKRDITLSDTIKEDTLYVFHKQQVKNIENNMDSLKSDLSEIIEYIEENEIKKK